MQSKALLALFFILLFFQLSNSYAKADVLAENSYSFYRYSFKKKAIYKYSEISSCFNRLKFRYSIFVFENESKSTFDNQFLNLANLECKNIFTDVSNFKLSDRQLGLLDQTSIKSQKRISRLFLYQENIPGKRLKKTGIIFTVLGAVFIAGSVAIFNYDSHNTYPVSTYPSIVEERTGVILGGLVTGACGIVMTGGGITLWSIGSHKMKAYKK